MNFVRVSLYLCTYNNTHSVWRKGNFGQMWRRWWRWWWFWRQWCMVVRQRGLWPSNVFLPYPFHYHAICQDLVDTVSSRWTRFVLLNDVDTMKHNNISTSSVYPYSVFVDSTIETDPWSSISCCLNTFGTLSNILSRIVLSTKIPFGI